MTTVTLIETVMGAILPFIIGALVAVGTTIPILTDMGNKKEVSFDITDIILRRMLKRVAATVFLWVAIFLLGMAFIARPLLGLIV